MNQKHNKREEVNTNDLENFIFEGEKSRREKYVLLFIVSLGAIGLLYVLNAPKEEAGAATFYDEYEPQSYDDSKSSDEYHLDAPKAPKSKKSPKRNKKQAIANHLKIDGYMEAKDPVYFSIDKFNDKATYTLRLDNGESIALDQQKNIYTFEAPGTYQAELDVTYKGKTHTIGNKKIIIQEAITVSRDADRVDFQ